MKPDPLPYQREGARALTRKTRFILADEMGLGKTCQAVLACDWLLLERVLCIVPASLRDNWRREFQLWSKRDLDIVVLYGSAELTAWTDAGRPGDVVVCSYELAASEDGVTSLTDASWDTVICDEAHYLKTPSSARTRAILGRTTRGKEVPFIGGVADRMWLLTGTPMPNNAMELFPALRSFGVWPDTMSKYRDRFCKYWMSDYGPKITGVKNAGTLRALLKTCMLRRHKEDVLPDLPPIRYATVTLDIKTAEEAMFPDLDEARDAARLVVEAIENGKPPPIGSHIASTRRLIGLMKAGPVSRLLETEFNCGLQKIVLFAHHREVIKRLADLLGAYDPVVIYGDTYAHAKQGIVDRFQTNPDCRVFIGQNTAAGVGITLTAAHDILHVEPDWVPANLAQATMRVHRIGQSERVLARMAVLKGSVDELITEALITKTRMIRDVMN